MSADQVAKADDLVAKADKKLKGWQLIGNKHEDALELLEKAVNSYKLGKACANKPLPSVCSLQGGSHYLALRTSPVTYMAEPVRQPGWLCGVTACTSCDHCINKPKDVLIALHATWLWMYSAP